MIVKLLCLYHKTEEMGKLTVGKDIQIWNRQGRTIKCWIASTTIL